MTMWVTGVANNLGVKLAADSPNGTSTTTLPEIPWRDPKMIQVSAGDTDFVPARHRSHRKSRRKSKERRESSLSSRIREQLRRMSLGLNQQSSSAIITASLDSQTARIASGEESTPMDSEHLSIGTLRTPGPPDPCTIIAINISGMRFQTYTETLERFPTTLLGSPMKRQRYFNKETGEYFFDRHRQSFEPILYWYQSAGRLKRPDHIPVDIFVQELKFFELGDEVVEQFWMQEGYKKPDEIKLPANKWQRAIYQLMEHPDTSVWARICAFVSVAVIITSIVSLCLETLPPFDATAREQRWLALHPNATNATEHNDFAEPFFIVESICIFWFTLEFMLRFLSCPSKCDFMKSFLNWVDFVAIAPFFVNLAFASGKKGAGSMSFAVLRVLRLVRVFRIFKLSRHSRGLQILGMTFKASIQELCLLVFFIGIGLVLFSSAMYFAEQGTDDTQFTSIPVAFWYTIVTMTTVGYGDMTPKGAPGKLVGSVCAISGVLVLALPVPVIVANFKHFYRQEARLAHMRASEDGDVDDMQSVSS